MEVYSRQNYPYILTSKCSSYWVLSNVDIYLFDVKQWQTDEHIQNRIKKVLTIEVNSTQLQIFCTTRLGNQCPDRH